MRWIRVVKTLSGCAIACAAMCRSCVDMSADLLVSLIFPSGKTLCPASPSLQWVPWVSVPHLPGLPTARPSVLCSAKTTACSVSVCFACYARAPIPCVSALWFAPRDAGRCAVTRSALGRCLYLRRASSRCAPQGDCGPLEFPGYPCAYMPRSRTPVVSSRLAICVSGTRAFRRSQTVGFPGPHRVILSDHNYNFFGALSRGLHARYTWLHTHPYGICMQGRCRFGGSPPLVGIARLPALTHWVTSTNFTVSFPIPRLWF
jgi:hypothetical protein